MHLMLLCLISLLAILVGSRLLNDTTRLAPFGIGPIAHPLEVPHDGVHVLQPLDLQMCSSSSSNFATGILKLSQTPNDQTVGASFMKKTPNGKNGQHRQQRQHREAFACAAGCSAREPQLEKSLAPWADWRQNTSGLDVLDALEGFCAKQARADSPFVLTVLWKQDVFVKACKRGALEDPSFYLIGPEDLSLVFIFLLSAQRLAPLPAGPIAFGMYLSDYTSLLDRHLVGPGLPIFAYLGRETSWLIPWPSSFTVLSTQDVEEWEKQQSQDGLVVASSAQPHDKDATPAASAHKQRPWKDREPIAYWIGAVTGPWDFAVDSGLMAIPRLKLLKMSKDHPKQIRAEWSNAAGYGISWIKDEERVSGFLAPRPRTILELTGIRRADYKDASSWDGFKYFINLDGVVLGGRLNKLLSLGGVVLQHQAGYIEHIDALAKPYEHYVPIEYDMSDLVAKIEWLQSNDDEAQRIGNNARKLAQQKMRIEDHLCYVWRALEALGAKTASVAADDHAVYEKLKGYRRVTMKEGGMRPTLEAFWGKKLETIATGDRIMSDRGLDLLRWTWDRFAGLLEKVERYKRV